MADDNNKLIQCRTCNGSGTILGQWDRVTGGINLRCPVCIGTGKVERTYTDGSYSTKSGDTPTQNLEETESDQEYEVNEEIVEEMRELGETRRAEKAKASQHMDQFLKQEDVKEQARKEQEEQEKRRDWFRSILTKACLILVILMFFALLFYSAEYGLFTPDSKTLTSSEVLELVEEYVAAECYVSSIMFFKNPFIASYEEDDLWHVYNEDQLKSLENLLDDNPNKKGLTFFTVNDKTQVVDTTYEGERSPTTTLCTPR